MTPVELTWDQVLSWRMERQLLHRPDGLNLTAIVRRLAGVQAQVASAAEQAVGVRRPDGIGGVPQALADRTIVKTWAMRGTLHLLAAEDAGAYLSLLAAARSWERAAWQRAFATAEQMAAITEAASAALDGAVLLESETFGGGKLSRQDESCCRLAASQIECRA